MAKLRSGLYIQTTSCGEHSTHGPYKNETERLRAARGMWTEGDEGFDQETDDIERLTVGKRNATETSPFSNGELMSNGEPFTVTLSGLERNSGEKPYTFVVIADDKDGAVDNAKQHFNKRCEAEFADMQLVEVVEGMPPANCGYYWNDCRPYFVRVEYDPAYTGGDYNGVGKFVFLSLADVHRLGVEKAFTAKTKCAAFNMIHYSEDELYDESECLVEV